MALATIAIAIGAWVQWLVARRLAELEESREEARPYACLDIKREISPEHVGHVVLEIGNLGAAGLRVESATLGVEVSAGAAPILIPIPIPGVIQANSFAVEDVQWAFRMAFRHMSMNLGKEEMHGVKAQVVVRSRDQRKAHALNSDRYLINTGIEFATSIQKIA